MLDAAGTKWNFLKFHPGLVGGHCIGVDPYYLTAKAEQLGYQPEVILSGRRVNDGMGAYVAQRVVKMLAASGRPIRKARVGILGFTFKENVPDIRNSKVIDTYRELREFGIEPIVHDARAEPQAVLQEYGIELAPLEEFSELDALIFAVGHEEYRPMHGRISDMLAQDGVIADVGSRPRRQHAAQRYPLLESVTAGTAGHGTSVRRPWPPDRTRVDCCRPCARH